MGFPANCVEVVPSYYVTNITHLRFKLSPFVINILKFYFYNDNIF